MEWVTSATSAAPTSTTTGESTEQILEVDVTRKAASESTTTESTTESVETSGASEWVGSGIRVEATVLIKGVGAILIVLLTLLGIREQLVGGLSLSKFIFGVRVLVGIRVILLG